MAMEQFRAPALPLPPAQYDFQYFNSLVKVLRLYFQHIDSLAACKAYSYRADYFYGGDAQLAGVTADTATITNATVNTLDFSQTDTSADQTARLRWNSVDATLNLGMQYGVVQQIGEELYARVINNTGVTIPNGTLVGFAGVGSGDALSVTPYIADGSMPSLYVLGVMTHDLPDSGQKGYCTVWGSVHDLNTSGYNIGDVLYASPTVAGGFTNVKPTAPNNVIPVAAVTTKSATAGILFVRPTIEQQKYYGTFSDLTMQTPGAIYTPQAITFSNTDIALGFSRGTPTSRIVASTSGYYNFQFSAQISSGSASVKTLWIWPRINGIDVYNSNSKITISGSGTELVASWNWPLSLNANDYFELIFAADDTNIQLAYEVAQTGSTGTSSFARPAVPSVILTVTQVQL
jgi:hypothetical protein